MDWQTQRQEHYKQQQAEKERIRQEVAEQQRLLLKAQFAEQECRKTEEQERLASLSAEMERVKQQQQTEANQRLAESLKLLDGQRHERQREAQERVKERKQHGQRVWIGQDGYKYRSPHELTFWEEWISDRIRAETMPLERQYHIGRYRADFADPLNKIAIEIDGWGFHGQRASDFERGYDRLLDVKAQDWDVIQFTAKRISRDVEGCVLYTYRKIEKRRMTR